MKIKKDVMTDFLTKARMEELQKALLQFTDEGMVLAAQDVANVKVVYGLLRKEAFEEYTALGNAGVDELDSIIKIFKKMDDVLEITIEGNLMTVSGKKRKVGIELTDEKFIDNVVEKPGFEPETRCDVEVKEVHDFINDINVNADTKIIFNTVKNGLILKNRKSDKYKFEKNVEAPGAKEGFKSKFGAPLVKALNGFKKGVVNLGLGTDAPIVITENSETQQMTILVAPQIDTE